MTANPQLASMYRSSYHNSLASARSYDAKRQAILKKIEQLQKASNNLNQQIQNSSALARYDLSRVTNIDESNFKGENKQLFSKKCKNVKSKLETYKGKHFQNQEKISKKITELQAEADSLANESAMAYMAADNYYALSLRFL